MADETKATIPSRSSRSHFTVTTPDGRSVESMVHETLTKSGIMSRSRAAAFMHVFSRCIDQRAEPVQWHKIQALQREMVIPHEDIEECPDDTDLQHELLNKLVILKLNGGLGTTMGCKGPKSTIEVRSGQTFLDMIVKQVEFLNSKYGVDVPLVLMNSYSTHEDTLKALSKYRDHNLRIHSFMQSCFPSLNKDTLMPVPSKPCAPDSADEWYPPGHGDVYTALFESGLLDNLISQGKEYVFISNVDNLGATVDLGLLFHMANLESEFMMEVTARTRADVQGGTLVSYDGKATLLEVSQVPPEHLPEFRSISGFPHFNTNNLWVGLRAIQRLVASDAIRTSVIACNRSVRGERVLQLETAAGAAISAFDRARAVVVPRMRFLPVKATSDLLLVQSNLFRVRHGSLEPSSLRPASLPVPVVKLGAEFQRLEEYERRFKGPLDVRELEHLTVAGDVIFNANMVLKGTVIIVANEGQRIELPPGCALEDKVVTGNLRIMEH